MVIDRPTDVSLRDPELANALRAACPEYSQKIIMGNLNANLLLELSFKVVNHGPTHFPLGGRPSWSDLICVDDSDVILDSGIGMPTFHSLHAK